MVILLLLGVLRSVGVYIDNGLVVYICLHRTIAEILSFSVELNKVSGEIEISQFFL